VGKTVLSHSGHFLIHLDADPVSLRIDLPSGFQYETAATARIHHLDRTRSGNQRFYEAIEKWFSYF
jgi:hypothetical protein